MSFFWIIPFRLVERFLRCLRNDGAQRGKKRRRRNEFLSHSIVVSPQKSRLRQHHTSALNDDLVPPSTMTPERARHHAPSFLIFLSRLVFLRKIRPSEAVGRKLPFSIFDTFVILFDKKDLPAIVFINIFESVFLCWFAGLFGVSLHPNQKI